MISIWTLGEKSVYVQELLQKGVVHIVISLLEMEVEFHNIALVRLLLHVCSNVLKDSIIASLRSPDSPLLTLHDWSFAIAEEEFLHPLVVGQGHELTVVFKIYGPIFQNKGRIITTLIA